jgi:hypothetical protein
LRRVAVTGCRQSPEGSQLERIHFPWAVLTVSNPAQTPGGRDTLVERYSFHFIFPSKLVDTSSGDETQLTLAYGAVEIRAFNLTSSGG